MINHRPAVTVTFGVLISIMTPYILDSICLGFVNDKLKSGDAYVGLIEAVDLNVILYSSHWSKPENRCYCLLIVRKKTTLKRE